MGGEAITKFLSIRKKVLKMLELHLKFGSYDVYNHHCLFYLVYYHGRLCPVARFCLVCVVGACLLYVLGDSFEGCRFVTTTLHTHR